MVIIQALSITKVDEDVAKRNLPMILVQVKNGMFILKNTW
jgi:hypothetical protein